MFTNTSKAIIYGLQIGAAQHMLDFDFLSGRTPSVVAFVNPGSTNGSHKLFYGDKEILIPSYQHLQEIPKTILDQCDSLVNFASFRSSFETSKIAMEMEVFQNIIIIAEGIPERQTRELIALNQKYKINIVGPATVGAMSAGKFRAGNTGGSLENIIASKLYQSGSVGFVSKSGGMSNECRRVIADRTDGTGLSIALGGDRYTLMDFPEAMKIMQKDDDVKMIVILGEVGGRDETEVAEMIASQQITKPVVAWCIGTIGEVLPGEVQFGHAGAKSNSIEETASYKNKALSDAGAHVPESYMDFGDVIQTIFEKYIKNSLSAATVKTTSEIQNKINTMENRKKTQFTSTISDERGEELLYNKKPIGEFTKQASFANVISNLWLKRDLPEYGENFINTLLILLADHGPAVSGAHNAIVTARAGNDLKSSLISGLATIGPKFGGAIDGAAAYFSKAVDKYITPIDFITTMKQQGINIPGIGHKVKSKFNPDARCEILLELSKTFPETKHLQFALAVEALTLEKKANLILNVDGMIAVMLLDLFSHMGMDTKEIQMYIDAGIFNGFFILARTTGFIGHIIDQKRLGEGLYRTPWDDIVYE